MKKNVYQVSKIYGEDGEFISGQYQFDTFDEAMKAAEAAAEHHSTYMTKHDKESRYNAIWVAICEWNEDFEEYQTMELLEEILIK